MKNNRAIFKKSLCLIISLLMMLPVLASCSNDATPDAGNDQTSQPAVENQDTTIAEEANEVENNTENNADIIFTEADGYTIAENDNLICKTDGTIIYLTNKNTNRELKLDLPSVGMNEGVSDIWEADADKSKAIKFTETKVFSENGNLCVLSEKDGVAVKTIISLVNSEAYFSAEIVNNGASVISTSEFPKMDLTPLNKFNAMWPFKDGEQYTTLNYINVGASYPSQLSMQLVTFYNAEESIYYYCADDTFSYKWYTFNTQSISIKQYPFIAPGETKTTAAVVIGFERGSWETASDIYRAWHLEATGGEREKNSVSANVNGINCIFISTYPKQIQTAYFKIPGTERMLRDTTGANLTILFGWHTDGFDSMYPDYKYYDELGGETAFVNAINIIHNNGGYVIPYTNAHIADTKSEWYQEQGLESATLKADGSIYKERYGTGLTYVAMCPSAQGFQDAFVAAAERLRKAGADGLWIDQLMEMPSFLCYNKDHGHTTPSTAYYPGYTTLMNRVDEVMATYGAEGQGWFYSCEGVCDAYSALIDVSTSVWSNSLGYVTWHCPEYTRYTMDLDVLGIAQANAVSGSNVFGRAFLMSMPILSGQGLPQECKDIVTIYDTNPKLYLDGEYLGQWKTDSVSNNGGTLYASLIGYDRQSGATILDRIVGDTVALQLYYTETAATKGKCQTVTQTYDFEREIASAIDAATGEACEFSGTTVTVSIDPGKVKSIICTFK